MKKIGLISLIISAIMLLSSCSSVYQIPDDTTDAEISVKEEEYFTTGSVYKKGDLYSGFLYKGYWIYCEKQDTSVKIHHSDGTRGNHSGPAQRLVKVNAQTGIVSSVCLDPACNHSYGSSCAVLAPYDKRLTLLGIVGDWVMYSFSHYDQLTAGYTESFIYNLQTGEHAKIFEYDIDGLEITKYESKCVFGNKLYSVRNDLDFSNTKYNPDGNKPISEFDPETVSTLCEYDFERRKSTDLFEIPDGYVVSAVTNKRFFLQSPDGAIYSCDKNGKDLKKEDVLDFSPQNMCGTYAYNILQNAIEIYDLRTNEKKTVGHDFLAQFVLVTDEGILIDHSTTADEYKEMIANHSEFRKEYEAQGMGLREISELYEKELNKIEFKGSAQVWSISLDGSRTDLIFEEEHASIKVFYAVDGYMYCFAVFGDPDNSYILKEYINEGRSYINIETGEITPIPYLDLVIPEYIEVE